MASSVQPRECTITKSVGTGYGFFLRIEKDVSGHLVRSVEKESPADKAGLQDGDRVLKVNGVFVDDKEHPEVVDLIKTSGNSVTLSILDEDSYLNAKKNGEDLSGKKPTSNEPAAPKPSDSNSLKPRLCYLVKDKGSFGFSLKCIKGTSGVFLENLAAGGVAAKAGVETGDRLIELNGKNVENDSYDKIVALVRESGDTIMFLVVDKATYDYFQQKKQKIMADQATIRLLPNPPRIVELTKGSEGYGFYLRQEKNRKGHFIVEIDLQSPADRAKLKDFDRIVAVNGQSVEMMQHEQVVELIRKGGNATTLLISDKTTDELYAKAGLSPFVYLREFPAPPPAYTEATNPVEPSSTKPAPTPEQPTAASPAISTPTAPTPATPPPAEPVPAVPPTQPTLSSSSQDPKNKPRLCRVQKGETGFGFNLNAIKDVPGQYFKQIVTGGSADAAGIKENDVLVEVNGVNVEKEAYNDVVLRIKQSGGTVTLLVVSKEGSEYYESQKIQITSSMADPLPESNNIPNASQNTPANKARSAAEPIEMENQAKVEEEAKKQDDDTAL